MWTTQQAPFELEAMIFHLLSDGVVGELEISLFQLLGV